MKSSRVLIAADPIFPVYFYVTPNSLSLVSPDPKDSPLVFSSSHNLVLFERSSESPTVLGACIHVLCREEKSDPDRLLVAVFDESKHVMMWDVDVISSQRMQLTFQSPKLTASYCMPKKASRGLFLPDRDILLLADRFGDIYELPIYNASLSSSVVDTQIVKELPIGTVTLNPYSDDEKDAQRISAKKVKNQHASDSLVSREAKQKDTTRVMLQLKPIMGHFSMLVDLAIIAESSNEDSKIKNGYIATADRGGRIRVSDFPNVFNIRNFLLGHFEYVSKIAWIVNNTVGSDTMYLVSAGGDKTVRLWDFKSSQLPIAYISLDAPVCDFLPDQENKCILVLTLETNTVSVLTWDQENLTLVKTALITFEAPPLTITMGADKNIYINFVQDEISYVSCYAREKHGSGYSLKEIATSKETIENLTVSSIKEKSSSSSQQLYVYPSMNIKQIMFSLKEGKEDFKEDDDNSKSFQIEE